MPIRRFIWLLIAAFSLALPLTAIAKDSRTLEFAAGEVNATWEGHGTISMQKQPDGILLSTTGTGFILTRQVLGIFPQAGDVTVSTDLGTGLYFVWIYNDDPDKRPYDVGISVPAGKRVTVPFSLSQHRQWYDKPMQFGLVLPPKTTILLHRIELTQWNFAERLLFGLKALWTFDAERPYSINFVWGPQIAWNPAAIKDLYAYLPPIFTSVTYALNIFLLLCFAVIAAFVFLRGNPQDRRKRFLRIALGVLLAGWVLLDVRMGSEFISWVVEDYRTYIAAPANLKTFRDRERFYDFAAFAVPYVFDRQTYVFFADREWPFLGNMRYLSYPAIPGIAYDRDDTWIIYNRPDITLDEQGRVTIGGEAVSLPGRVLGRFDSGSFAFRTYQKPVLPSPSPAK